MYWSGVTVSGVSVETVGVVDFLCVKAWILFSFVREIFFLFHCFFSNFCFLEKLALTSRDRLPSTFIISTSSSFKSQIWLNHWSLVSGGVFPFVDTKQ